MSKSRLSSDERNNFAQDYFDQRDVIRIYHASSGKEKMFIIVGYDEEKHNLGLVFINSQINANVYATPDKKSQHHILKENTHPFLNYDSYVDCNSIEPVSSESVLTIVQQSSSPDEVVIGRIRDSDMEEIKSLLLTSRTLSQKEKRRYGII